MALAGTHRLTSMNSTRMFIGFFLNKNVQHYVYCTYFQQQPFTTNTVGNQNENSQTYLDINGRPMAEVGRSLGGGHQQGRYGDTDSIDGRYTM